MNTFRKIAYLFLLTSSLCYSQNKISQPEKDFETFWTTFKNNYAFFKLKKVNWDSTYIKFRPLVSKNTNQDQLVSILGKMVEPLKDGHVTISKGDEMVFSSKKTSQFRNEFKGVEKEFWQTVNKTLEANGFQAVVGIGPIFKDQNLFYFSQTPEIGYIRISRCFGNAESLYDDKKEILDIKLMLDLLDNLISKIENTKTLIIDLRGNGGGHAGLEMASRFVKTKTLTHYKAVKTKGDYNTFTPLEPQYISPYIGKQFLKNLIILTNDKTASSAEDFTISLYKQDNVVTIGTNTSGMMSDMFSGELSNSISFTLSNQVYYSTDKEILEDRGVPVKYRIENTKQDITNQIDPVIVKALNLFQNN